MAHQTTLYIDQETKSFLAAIAQREGRTQIEVLRRMVNGGMYLGALPPFDQAVLHQVAKDEGLDSLLDATSHIISDWQRLKAAAEYKARPHAPAIRMPATVAQPEEV